MYGDYRKRFIVIPLPVTVAPTLPSELIKLIEQKLLRESESKRAEDLTRLAQVFVDVYKSFTNKKLTYDALEYLVDTIDLVPAEVTFYIVGVRHKDVVSYEEADFRIGVSPSFTIVEQT